VAWAGTEGCSFLQEPEHSHRGKRSPRAGQGGHSQGQAFGGKGKKIPHGPVGLNLPSLQDTATKIGRKALPLSPVPSCSSPHHRHPPSPFNYSCPLALKPPNSCPLGESASACLLSQAYQRFPPATGRFFPLFSVSALVNSHMQQGSPQAFVYPRHIPLSSLQQRQEEKWFRIQSWLQANVQP